ARASTGLPSASGALAAALRDDRPRVREAALRALGAPEATVNGTAEREVLALLRTDPWTFVRAAASGTMAARPPNAVTDEALLAGLAEDPSSIVRATIIDALGERKSPATIDAVRDKADEPKESLAVRKAALRALGAMCDVEAVDLLTKLAQRAAAAQVPYDRPLGEVALRALGEIHPADLPTRLAPLLAPKVPPNLRRIARGILRQPGSCDGSARPSSNLRSR
ncbi:MAG: HEAT repeat domain-containing protein, partial [Deltaproteobacteria bacterium]|nr:HEAT repeat domain-containing protein [Deltaproteobacteria bacterium]MBW2531968.1 HEAT repeat domain-containing protein [Deltaproteobacteria bacterium]